MGGPKSINLDRFYCTNELVALATNGAATIIGSHHGVMTSLRNDVPTLINTYCVANQEALFASDGFKTTLELLTLD
jgi:hypothetical protein